MIERSTAGVVVQLIPGSDGIAVGQRFFRKTPSELGVREKAIETWIAEHPEILFPNEEVLVIAQSVAGESMADVLALDTLGNLIIVEIKRDWADRTTVGQLLEYAAKLHGCGYERLDEEARRYAKHSGRDLYSAFLEFIDREDFPRDLIGRRQRVVIVAPESDTGLAAIVEWLRTYGVPIEFVPFSVFADQEGRPSLLMISGVTTSPDAERAEDDRWAGHWIFNTNETHAPGAYETMFREGVAAIYGYENGPQNLQGSSAGERIFAYVNRQGLRALGTIVDGDVYAGRGIFVSENGDQLPDEYHIRVQWDVILPRDQAISASEAAEFGYNLPVRTVFGRLHKGTAAEKLEREMLRRSPAD